MRRVIIIVGVTIVALCAATYVGYSKQQECPPCYYDRAPMGGQGRGSELPQQPGCNCAADTGLCTGCPGDNRRVIRIKFDAAWVNGRFPDGGYIIEPAIYNATKCATERWMGTKGSNGLGIHFVLYIDQNATNPDITIARRDLENFAETTRTGPPFTMYLDPAILSHSAENNCGRVAHELGHPLNAGGAPTSCVSIMRGSSGDGSRMYNNVLARDVDAVQKNFDDARRPDCTKSYQTDRGEQIEDGGGDGGGGDPCGGDPCCGDPCCGDPCCYDSYCGDPCRGDPCCGDPNCGQQCYEVCDETCVTECTDEDLYYDRSNCTGDSHCSPINCRQVCY